ncbi:hypothetical protein D0Y65_023008 [Glycine soja]|uniref:Uncharacterized protein n=1 Tax=Glycine soja TaxID=3848 RepID=A0A445IW87_GLYSO|nr:hypothetical protein D0Y65_023008 [Glycine soja]
MPAPLPLLFLQFSSRYAGRVASLSALLVWALAELLTTPLDFWLLEKIDPYCSGWLKLHGDHSSKKRKEKENNYARNIIFHGGVWFAHKNKNQGRIQPTLG